MSLHSKQVFKTNDDRDLIAVIHFGRIVWIVVQQDNTCGYRFDLNSDIVKKYRSDVW